MKLSEFLKEDEVGMVGMARKDYEEFKRRNPGNDIVSFEIYFQLRTSIKEQAEKISGTLIGLK